MMRSQAAMQRMRAIMSGTQNILNWHGRLGMQTAGFEKRLDYLQQADQMRRDMLEHRYGLMGEAADQRYKHHANVQDWAGKRWQILHGRDSQPTPEQFEALEAEGYRRMGIAPPAGQAPDMAGQKQLGDQVFAELLRRQAGNQ
jgi:hypothetical protein